MTPTELMHWAGAGFFSALATAAWVGLVFGTVALVRQMRRGP